VTSEFGNLGGDDAFGVATVNENPLRH